jgi:hypothetical protein
MFQGFGSGSQSSIAKRMHPGWHTWVIWKGPSQLGGKLVGTLPAKDPPKHQIVHLELHVMHEPLVVALERLAAACIFNRRLSSSLIN